MRFWLWCAVALAACTPASAPLDARSGGGSEAATPAEVILENLGAAPELNNRVWLNSDRPLRLAELRGKVVLIDFWTFG